VKSAIRMTLYQVGQLEAAEHSGSAKLTAGTAVARMWLQPEALEGLCAVLERRHDEIKESNRNMAQVCIGIAGNGAAY
jgi:hypothetical protein